MKFRLALLFLASTLFACSKAIIESKESPKNLEITIIDNRDFKNSPLLFSFPSEASYRQHILLDAIEATLFEKLKSPHFASHADALTLALEKLEIGRYKNLESDFILVSFSGKLHLVKNNIPQSFDLFANQMLDLKSLDNALDENEVASDVVFFGIAQHLK